ncbi:hypothetical protein A1OE_531 [Candidatus Endolissoclinum faulkneri L2]|uniref:Uncharacterized protein n=1 Tax=Candidatus Endolissoclinum faulkneri L2 TaxID=1193729 RepID=K7YQ72_9PROT|nr:hypothetical protein A1OE_531 [Candidatus Endolissoclinum faulkneri L2]
MGININYKIFSISFDNRSYYFIINNDIDNFIVLGISCISSRYRTMI